MLVNLLFQMKGDLSAERKERYDNALQVYQKLMVNANIYSVSRLTH